jgi:hypothetical protein
MASIVPYLFAVPFFALFLESILGLYHWRLNLNRRHVDDLTTHPNGIVVYAIILFPHTTTTSSTCISVVPQLIIIMLRMRHLSLRHVIEHHLIHGYKNLIDDVSID